LLIFVIVCIVTATAAFGGLHVPVSLFPLFLIRPAFYLLRPAAVFNLPHLAYHFLLWLLVERDRFHLVLLLLLLLLLLLMLTAQTGVILSRFYFLPWQFNSWKMRRELLVTL
jgi:hypothetical protein